MISYLKNTVIEKFSEWLIDEAASNAMFSKKMPRCPSKGRLGKANYRALKSVLIQKRINLEHNYDVLSPRRVLPACTKYQDLRINFEVNQSFL